MAEDLDRLTALHHPVRRRIWELLRLSGAATVGTIASELHQQVGSVSHHLRTLQRAGFVAPAPELASDGRQSWWRHVPARMSWSVRDFADSPGDLLLAESVERANLAHHVDKVSTWLAERDGYDDRWAEAAFATDTWCTATAEELTDLQHRLVGLLLDWQAGCERSAEGEDEEQRARRTPVFVQAHANPARA